MFLRDLFAVYILWNHFPGLSCNDEGKENKKCKQNCFKICVLVMLITGGGNEDDNVFSSTEVIDPSGRTCVVQDMTKPRGGHAMAGRTVCGDDTCETLDNDGKWRLSHKLQENRTGLGMWTAEVPVLYPDPHIVHRTYVMGGRNRNNTNTLITEELYFESSFKRWALQEEIHSYGFR